MGHNERAGRAVGRLHHLVLDCPEPDVLAEFYAAITGMSITFASPDFVVVAADATSSGLAFQRAADHEPPTWPDPAIPQQMHLDVMVDDVYVGGKQVVSLGAQVLDARASVYADPAGHPFCLVKRPEWALPIAAPP